MPYFPGMLSLQPLPPADQSRIATLWHYQGDVVSFLTATASDPHEMLLWLAQPHIQPWLETIAAHFRTRRETSASDALTRSLADLNKVLDLDAGPTLRVRAVNSIIKLAHAIYRGTRLAPIHANLRTQLQQNADSDLATAKSNAIRRSTSPSRREGAGGWVTSDPRPPSDQREISIPLPAPSQSEHPKAGVGLASSQQPQIAQREITPPSILAKVGIAPLTPISLPHHEDPNDPLAPRNWPSQNPTYDLMRQAALKPLPEGGAGVGLKITRHQEPDLPTPDPLLHSHSESSAPSALRYCSQHPPP
jgi:hypothetical protein